jgi:hypothetical protein
MLLISIEIVKSSNPMAKFQCLIENSRYQNEYLYPSRDPKTPNTKHIIFSTLDFSIKQKDPVKWLFIKLNDSVDTYYLKNEQANEYMCASSNVIDKGFEILFSMTKKRLIYSLKIVNEKEKILRNQMPNMCKWRLERIYSDKSFKTYIIWNVQFKDPIQIGTHSHKINGKYSRNIYLKAKKSAQDELKWILHC